MQNKILVPFLVAELGCLRSELHDVQYVIHPIQGGKMPNAHEYCNVEFDLADINATFLLRLYTAGVHYGMGLWGKSIIMGDSGGAQPEVSTETSKN